MGALPEQFYRVGDVEIDVVRGCIRRHGVEQHLRRKTFQVLVYLLEQHERLVTKDEIIEKVWNGLAVTDDALVQCVVDIRKIFGDDSRHPQFIKTIPKLGYRFIAPFETGRESNLIIIEREEITSVSFEIKTENSDPPPLKLESRKKNQSYFYFINALFGQRKVLLASFLVFLAVSAGVFFIQYRNSRNASAEVLFPVTEGKRTLAVMSFENQTGREDLDWLRAGLADMLITNLSRSRHLAVLSRSQIFLLLERNGHTTDKAISSKNAIEFARRSNAEVVVTGGFAAIGDKIRIDVQVHNVREGGIMAGETLLADRPEQILTQIDLLSLRIASCLSNTPQTPPRISEVMTNDLEAYRLYSLALEKAESYHSGEAIVLLEKAISRDPQFAMAYARIGYIYRYLRVEEYDKAKFYLEKAFRLSDRLTDKDKLYIKAWYGEPASKGNKEAIRTYYELIEHYPMETEAYLRLGFLLGFEGRYEEKIEVLKRGLLVDAESREIYNQLGFAYSKDAHYQEAINAHERYIQLAPDEPNAHDSLGMTLNEAGRYSEALASFNRALELKPDFHFAHRHRGDVFFRLGRYRDALAEYQLYLQAAPTDWDRAAACNLMTLVYLEQNDLKKAGAMAVQEIKYKNDFGGSMLVALKKEDWSKAKNLNDALLSGKSENALGPKGRSYLLGLYALKTGKTDEALQYFKESSAASRYLWNVDTTIDCLANAYLELGRPREAIAEYENLLSVNPNWIPARYRLAQALERDGQTEKARAEYKQFLELWKDADENLPQVLEAKQKLFD
jgi:tetratricopeptide (TPR) repeat protein/DNA-binding winged helix-turn-helix (wHTH) protein